MEKVVILEADKFIAALDEQFHISIEQKNFVSGYLCAWLDTAEHRVQLTNFGVGMRASLARLLVSFAYLIAPGGN